MNNKIKELAESMAIDDWDCDFDSLSAQQQREYLERAENTLLENGNIKSSSRGYGDSLGDWVR